MSGDYVIAAPRERVWAALNDPEVLRRSIEGCESLDRISDTSFAARVVARIGPVKAAFGGKIALSEIDAPSSYTISGEGSGGGVGMARGSARVRLTDQGGGATRLSYTVAAEVSGKLAQIGSRLIDGAARKMADDFFGRFAALAAEGVAGPAQRAPKAKGRYAVELDLRWAAIAAVLLAAASGWIGYLLGHGAHP